MFIYVVNQLTNYYTSVKSTISFGLQNNNACVAAIAQKDALTILNPNTA